MAAQVVRQIAGGPASPSGAVPLELFDNWRAMNPAARLGDRLSQQMARLIDSGEFGEGARLPAESSLATRFGVSRPIIREALSRLRATGVITSRKGSGSYVRKRLETPSGAAAADAFGPFSSLAQVRKCYEFRASLEGDAAYYAAQNRTPDVLLIMREALGRMDRAITEGTVGMHADIEFHFAVARASGNEFFEAVMQLMRTPLEFAVDLARSLALKRPLEHLLIVQGEHVALFEAIEAQDRNAARSAMRRHIQNACWRVFEGPDGSPEPFDSADDPRPA